LAVHGNKSNVKNKVMPLHESKTILTDSRWKQIHRDTPFMGYSADSDTQTSVISKIIIVEKMLLSLP